MHRLYVNVTLTVGADTRYRCHREFGDRRESVVAARTYFYKDEEQCEKNLQNILNAIDAVSTGEQSFREVRFLYYCVKGPFKCYVKLF